MFVVISLKRGNKGSHEEDIRQRMVSDFFFFVMHGGGKKWQQITATGVPGLGLIYIPFMSCWIYQCRKCKG